MKFCKYQGTGNDFIVTDGMADGDVYSRERIRSACDRHFGVGADGFIAAVPSGCADVRMAFYNSDGSRASMCGNGIRCFAKFVRDHGIVKSDIFTVETGDGIRHVTVVETAGKRSEVRVDMGAAAPFRIVRSGSNSGFCTGAESAKESEESGPIYATHLGVPHAVLFFGSGQQAEAMAQLDGRALRDGAKIEHAPEFQPSGTNVNFVSIADTGHILCSTWERGAGKTLACGTGACSAAAAARRFMGCGDEIRVTMPGGDVTVSFSEDGTAFMQGPAVLICSGDLEE